MQKQTNTRVRAVYRRFQQSVVELVNAKDEQVRETAIEALSHHISEIGNLLDELRRTIYFPAKKRKHRRNGAAGSTPLSNR